LILRVDSLQLESKTTEDFYDDDDDDYDDQGRLKSYRCSSLQIARFSHAAGVCEHGQRSVLLTDVVPLRRKKTDLRRRRTYVFGGKFSSDFLKQIQSHGSPTLPGAGGPGYRPTPPPGTRN
jgi:hypothetical protein